MTSMSNLKHPRRSDTGNTGEPGTSGRYDFKRNTHATLRPLVPGEDATPVSARERFTSASTRLAALRRPGQHAAVAALTESLAWRAPDVESVSFELAYDEDNGDRFLRVTELRNERGYPRSLGISLENDIHEFTGDLADSDYLNAVNGPFTADPDNPNAFTLALKGAKPPGRAGRPAAETFVAVTATQAALCNEVQDYCVAAAKEAITGATRAVSATFVLGADNDPDAPLRLFSLTDADGANYIEDAVADDVYEIVSGLDDRDFLIGRGGFAPSTGNPFAYHLSLV
jgi:hypothetical protein